LLIQNPALVSGRIAQAPDQILVSLELLGSDQEDVLRDTHVGKGHVDLYGPVEFYVPKMA
jgi:hypothetical protein